MIDLGNGYFVCPTNYGYNLSIDKGQKNKETGQTVYFPISYHGSLASAIAAAMRETQRKTLASGDFTLKEAVETLEKIQKDFAEILKETIEKKEKIEK